MSTTVSDNNLAVSSSEASPMPCKLLADRASQLIARIQPSQHSERRREIVSEYVTQIVQQALAEKVRPARTFNRILRTTGDRIMLAGAGTGALQAPCILSTMGLVVLSQVSTFMFGSVPLKTYLPDGDIDLSIFCAANTSVKDTWTSHLQVRSPSPWPPLVCQLGQPHCLSSV